MTWEARLCGLLGDLRMIKWQATIHYLGSRV